MFTPLVPLMYSCLFVPSQNMRGGMKKQKLDKEKDRDISEKIALGMHKGGGAKGGADL